MVATSSLPHIANSGLGSERDKITEYQEGDKTWGSFARLAAIVHLPHPAVLVRDRLHGRTFTLRRIAQDTSASSAVIPPAVLQVAHATPARSMPTNILRATAVGTHANTAGTPHPERRPVPATRAQTRSMSTCDRLETMLDGSRIEAGGN
jgi:hypothetical protein